MIYTFGRMQNTNTKNVNIIDGTEDEMECGMRNAV